MAYELEMGTAFYWLINLLAKRFLWYWEAKAKSAWFDMQRP